MQKIIKNESIEIEINSLGAYIESLTFKNIPIIFSRKEIKENGILKDRGGSHICLPFFGLNDNYDLPRHGFGRESKWELIHENENEVTYELKNSTYGYEHLVSRLSYIIHENTVITKLVLKNIGNKELEVSPAFHPYFKFEDMKNVKINKNKILFSKEELEESVFIEEVYELETEKYIVNFRNKDLNRFVLWSSFSENFLCVEPTYNLLEKTYILKSGESKEFNFAMIIKLK